MMHPVVKTLSKLINHRTTLRMRASVIEIELRAVEAEIRRLTNDLAPSAGDAKTVISQ